LPRPAPTTLRALLNGREITGKFVRPANSACLFTTCDWSARVTSVDGLVAGRNELRVEARGQGAVRHSDARVFVVEAPTGITSGPITQRLGTLIAVKGKTTRASLPIRSPQ